MKPPDEVEFFVDTSPVSATDEDSVDLGQGRAPRWAIGIVGPLVAALLVVLASQAPNTPVAAPTPAPQRIDLSPTSTSGLGSPIPIDRVTPVDGRTGSVLQHWPDVVGTVTSRKGSAYILREGALIPLVMDGCTG